MKQDVPLNYREAEPSDFEQMHVVRMAVRENILPDAGLITADDYTGFITERGKGWLCETETAVVGFAIVDLKERNIWALFVDPQFEGNGIGKALHEMMLNWYFAQTSETVWLGTSPETRAADFYRKAGWTEIGLRPNGEIRFEMSAADWAQGQKLRVSAL